MTDPYPSDTKWRVGSHWCRGNAIYESGNPRLGDPMPPHGCTSSNCEITTISGPITGGSPPNPTEATRSNAPKPATHYCDPMTTGCGCETFDA